jgi:hypothetical protein
MQAEWGKRKKKGKRSGKAEQQRDSSDFAAMLITFLGRRGRKLF